MPDSPNAGNTEPFVAVTLTEIYRMVKSVGDNVNGVDAKVTMVDTKVDKALDGLTDAKDEVRSLKQRMSAVEKKVWTFSGAAMVLGAIGEYAFTHLIK